VLTISPAASEAIKGLIAASDLPEDAGVRRSAITRSRETGSPARSSSTASSARCRAPASASGRPSARASTGPRTLKSTAQSFPPSDMRGNCCHRTANAPQPPERMIRAANPATRLTTKETSMTTLTKAYPTELAARRGVEALRATGVPERDIRLLAGTAPRDIRHEPVGGFAGPVAPDAPIGTYGGRVLQRRQGAGSFAGDPDRQRQGSFADTDRDVIVTYDDGAERTRVTGDLGVRRLLREAALDDAAADRVVDELHAGHAVVLADVAEIAPSDAQARLDQVAQAA
jgi:hypothetical protein